MIQTYKTSTLTFLAKQPPLPFSKTVFYFSLSGEDSLLLPPFCTPVDILVDQSFQVISTTLPHHEHNARPYHIRELWEKDVAHIEMFIQALAQGIKELTSYFPPPYGVMGLSRGAFIALWIASMVKEVTTAVCFAPMLELNNEGKLSIKERTSLLKNKKIHFFIGDNDSLVGTDRVISLHNELSSHSKLEIYPSIGRMGHGTPHEMFNQGALWMIKNL